MKSLFLKYIILLSLAFSITYAQEDITEELKQKYIQDLSSEDPFVVSDALLSISYHKIVEAVPVIESKQYRQIELSNRMLSLDLLSEFKSPNASKMIKGFMDSLVFYMKLENKHGGFYKKHYFSDTLDYKIKCAWYLAAVDDYTYLDLMIDDIKSQWSWSHELNWIEVLKKFPQHADMIKSKIFNNIKDTTKAGGVFKARPLYELIQIYGTDFFPELLDLTRNCLDPWIRDIALGYLVEMNYPNIVELIKERMLHDSYTAMKREFLDTLLYRYGTINEYIFIKNNYKNIYDPILDPYDYDDRGKTLLEYIPKEPSKETEVVEMLDTLVSILKTTQSENWLSGQNFVIELNNYLSYAKAELVKWDSIGCAIQVNNLQNAVDKEYKDTTNLTDAQINKDAWKFLFYNAYYIIKRLPSIPPPIIANITPETVTAGSTNFTLTVNGKNFTNGSTVYINNNAKTTTYVSDTVLQANILSSDVAVTDTLLVTVKNILGDSTSTESNPIKLYITPRQENVDALITHSAPAYKHPTQTNG